LFCSFFRPPVTSSLFGSNILLSTLFSNTISLCFSLNVRDQDSQLHNIMKREEEGPRIMKSYKLSKSILFEPPCTLLHTFLRLVLCCNVWDYEHMMSPSCVWAAIKKFVGFLFRTGNLVSHTYSVTVDG
jgi:hypothetical protein